MEKLIPKLKTHFEWLGKQSIAPILTPNTLKILCNGGFYIGGRDKFYRPTVIMDGGVMAQMAKDDKTMMEAALEVILCVFTFLCLIFILSQQKFSLRQFMSQLGCVILASAVCGA